MTFKGIAIKPKFVWCSPISPQSTVAIISWRIVPGGPACFSELGGVRFSLARQDTVPEASTPAEPFRGTELRRHLKLYVLHARQCEVLAHFKPCGRVRKYCQAGAGASTP